MPGASGEYVGFGRVPAGRTHATECGAWINGPCVCGAEPPSALTKAAGRLLLFAVVALIGAHAQTYFENSRGGPVAAGATPAPLDGQPTEGRSADGPASSATRTTHTMRQVRASVPLTYSLTGARTAWRSGYASAYGPGLYGNPTACRRPNGTVRYLSPTMLGVAHRSLPCNSRITVCRSGVCARVLVIDRGPFVRGRVLDLTEGTTRRFWHKSARQWGVRWVRYRKGWA